MSALDNIPTNKNFLNPLNFTFVLKRSPNLNFFVQSINIPNFYLTTYEAPSPTLIIPYAMGHITYQDLHVTFKVDEDFQNYMEIYDWLKALGQIQTPAEYKKLQDNPKSSGQALKSDISLIISDSLKNPNYEITFVDCFPSALGEVNFQTTDESVNYVSATTVFKYTYFNIAKI